MSNTDLRGADVAGRPLTRRRAFPASTPGSLSRARVAVRPALASAWLLAFVVANALAPWTARGEFRHALVIGQSTYKAGTLAAPLRDGAAVAEALAKRGFQVTRVENLGTLKELDDAVKAFARSVPTGGTALVYYSGNAAFVSIPQPMKPPREELACVSLDGGKQPLSTVLRPLVVPQYSPYGHGWQGLQSGSRINVLIVDSAIPPWAAPSTTAGAPPSVTLPEFVPPADSFVVLRPAEETNPPSDMAGLSPLAERFVAGLNSAKPLDAVLSGLSPRTLSSLAAHELARLGRPVSKAVSGPTTLGPGTRPGDEWVDASGMVFCWCPAGEIEVGSPPQEPERQEDESQAIVSFADGFWMAKHELSYRESVGIGGGAYLSTGEHKLQPLNLVRPEHVAKILEAANAAAPAGWEYGVPSEAEWEYAARAGSKTPWSFGANSEDLPRYANFADRALREGDCFGEHAKTHRPKSETPIYFGDRQTGLFSYAHPNLNDGVASLARVGSYLPNAWGLCDMHGNVAELTSTIYDASRLGPVVPFEKRAEWGARPENKKYALGSVSKGGNWASTLASCRSAFRGWGSALENIHGVRLILRRKGAIVEPLDTRWSPLVPQQVSSASGAAATMADDGAVLMSGTAVAGDTYTVVCPVPAGMEPRAIRLEILADASLPKQGPGRHPGGNFHLSEVSIAAVRGGGASAKLDVLDVRSDFPNDVRSDRPEAPSANLVDGRPETVWGGAGDGKNHEVVFTIGLPTRTGGDSARWRYPVASTQPWTQLVVTISHPVAPQFGAATLGKFRVMALHEEAAAIKEAAR